MDMCNVKWIFGNSIDEEVLIELGLINPSSVASFVFLPCCLARYSMISKEISRTGGTRISCPNMVPELLQTVFAGTKSSRPTYGLSGSTACFPLLSFYSAALDTWLGFMSPGGTQSMNLDKNAPSRSLLFLKR
jgi:hypothetical protein